MTKARRAAGLLLVAAALFGGGVLHSPAMAFSPDLPPGARLTGEAARDPQSFSAASGPWAGGDVPRLSGSGRVALQSWTIPDAGSSTFDLIASLRGALTAEGYEIVFECETDQCGGFDFRYAVEVLPEPGMHVDLGDFRYLLARRAGPKGPELAAVLVSRSQTSLFLQVHSLSPDTAAEAPAAPPANGAPDPAPQTESPVADAGLGESLRRDGRVALDDLVFASGAGTLGEGDFASLAALADYLRARPEDRVVIVGHTDATGPLAVNVALSRQRAESVAERLVARHGVARAQVSAEGVGFLAPRATNLTDEGRRKNRRVEAILASTR